MNYVIRGLDVGFGSVKLTGADTSSLETCISFPSMAVGRSSLSLGSDQDVVVLNVDGKDFLVGRGVTRYMDSGAGRVLREGFSATPEYKALVLGALYMMGQTRIDKLVMGLPVNMFARRMAELQWVKGNHRVAGSEIEVASIEVVPQPLGGYASWMSTLDLVSRARSQAERTLIVDPGYYSLDWLVIDRVNISGARSGALSHGGMGRIIRAIASEMGRKLGRSLEYELMYSKIEEGMRTKQPIKVAGEYVRLEDYQVDALQMSQDAVGTMMNTLQSTDDIENIVLVGGGAKYYRQAVSNALGNREVQIGGHGEFANAMGFHAIGRQNASRGRLESVHANQRVPG